MYMNMDGLLGPYIEAMMLKNAPQQLPTPIAPVAQPISAPVAAPIPVPVPVPAPVDETATKRKQFLGEVEQKFGTNYGQKNIGSTLLDDTINSILQEQKADASSYLERGRKRGIYNDTGYNAGVARLGADEQAGRSKLYSLGNSVIDKYRSDANTVRDKAYSAANSWGSGQNFSLDPYIDEGNEVISRANNFAGGDLRNAFGGTKLFDFSSLNNRAGQAQGAINARDLDVVSAINNRKRANSFGRGLGSQGAF